MPIDYSKFDAIEDSDDEKESKDKKPSEAGNAAAATKPLTCPNCYKELAPGQGMRCTRCKKVSYCSRKCQAEDWQFHKRVCFKEEPAKARDPAPPSRPKPDAKKAREEKVVVEDDDDVGTWYKHREWKPEQKKEFKPTQVQDGQQVAAPQKAPTAGSVWNAAGTWEDSDETEWAKSRLPQMLVGLQEDLAGGRGSLEVEKVDNVAGDASVSVVRGTSRYLFDLTFTVHVVARWMGAGGSKTAKAKIKILEFTDNLVHDFVEAEGFPCEVSTEGGDEISLSTMLREPVGPKAAIFRRMLGWAKEFQSKRSAPEAK